MPKLIYQAIEPLTRDEVSAAVERNDPAELSIVVLSVALHDQNHTFAESFCLEYSDHSDGNVKGNAILGFGHIARIHQKLDKEKIKPVIMAGLNDENEYVRGRSADVRDDIEWYLKWKYK